MTRESENLMAACFFTVIVQNFIIIWILLEKL